MSEIYIPHRGEFWLSGIEVEVSNPVWTARALVGLGCWAEKVI